MSITLGSIIVPRQNITVDETNLERGTIYTWSSGAMLSPLCFCWNAPGTGTAVIEIWGSGGSGARMCCCGFGLPGNTGAYSSRTITMNTGNFVCGVIGLSCGNASSLCFRGCSDPTQICWTSTTGNGCMCAQGGRGGISFCSTSTSFWCCFFGNGFCGTCCGPSCGVICNVCSGAFNAQAFGGTVNCSGCFSCVLIGRCDVGAIWTCGCQPSLAVPPNMGAACGLALNYGVDIDNRNSNASGSGVHASIMATASANRFGSNFMPSLFACYTGSVSCGCYEMNGCIPFVPPAYPGAAAHPCGEVRDHGGRGGNGLVKITFL